MNAAAPKPHFGRPYHGGSISKRAGKYALQIYDGIRVQWAGTFATRELAEAARQMVREARERGAPLPAFAKDARTCGRCRQPGHDARTCAKTTVVPVAKALLSAEERGGRITEGLLRFWRSKAGDDARARRHWIRHPEKRVMRVMRAPRPPACVRCFRVGHYASQCPGPPATRAFPR